MHACCSQAPQAVRTCVNGVGGRGSQCVFDKSPGLPELTTVEVAGGDAMGRRWAA